MKALARVNQQGKLGDTLVLKHGGNSLNFLRLALALLVIISHSITLGGFGSEDLLGNHSFGGLAVDGFFGISGYLICGSALRHIERRGRWKGLAHYFWDRALRILPAFWVCLIATAGILAPIGWLVVHHSLSGYGSHSHGPVHYVLSNLFLRLGALQISGTPAHVPYPFAWDKSLWTLMWEFLCYIGIAFLAALGLLFRRRIIVGMAVLVWMAEIAVFFHPFAHASVEYSTRFASVFLVGALLYLYKDRIPDSGALALGLMALACIGFSVGDPTSRVSDWLTGPSLVYPVLWLGAHLPFRRVGATNDISYGVYIYAFPVGQLLAIENVQRAGYVTFMCATVACTIPLAAASWWGLEKWALKARAWQPFSRSEVVAVSQRPQET